MSGTARRNGQTLIVAEKPEAARRIAEALDQKGKAQKLEMNGVPYFKAENEHETVVVVPALGHLYTVVQERGRRDYYPVFNYRWVPKYVENGKDKQLRTFIETIASLSEEAERWINACDYDIEGSTIGYTILKYACGEKEKNAARMKFSTLMDKEIQDAYQSLSPSLDFNLVEAGLTRHEVDWLWGVNLSRALMLAARHWSGRHTTLSTGRVQGPTLGFLAEREKEIRSFVPTPFWEVKAKVEIGNVLYDVAYESEKLPRIDLARRIAEETSGKDGTVEDVQVREYQQAPPTPFDLGSLQSDAYRHFGYTPSRTLNIAERLYLGALISYPRTSSQKLPPAIGYRDILRSLGKRKEYADLVKIVLSKRDPKPQEGKKEDPAHPAIYPTGNTPQSALSPPEEKLLDLITKRFLAVFGDTALRQSMRAVIKVNGYTFYLSGRRILKEGWLRLYQPYAKEDEVILPPLEKGQKIPFGQVTIEDKFVSPPPRYNPSSVLRLMEEEGIGTKATRAAIVDTLYDRGYIRDERMVVTDLGFTVTETLEKNSPRIVSVAFTRELEERMEKIETGTETRENVLAEAINRLKPILEELRDKETPIGQTLSEAIRRAQLERRVIGPCPVCRTGNLIIIYSRKTGKRFAGCTNFRNGTCKAAFPLPQHQYGVKPARRSCKICQWPVVEVKPREKRPWNLCLNPDCPSKAKYQKVKE